MIEIPSIIQRLTTEYIQNWAIQLWPQARESYANKTHHLL
jgi:hypothetical protein